MRWSLVRHLFHCLLNYISCLLYHLRVSIKKCEVWVSLCSMFYFLYLSYSVICNYTKNSKFKMSFSKEHPSRKNTMYQYIQHEITCVQIYNIQALLSTKYNGWKLRMRMTVSCSNGARMCFQSMKRRQNKLYKTIFRTFSFPVNNAEYLFGVFLKTMTSMQVWKFEIKIRRCNWNIRRIYIMKMMIILFPKKFFSYRLNLT